MNYEQIESSQRQHFNELQHQVKMNSLVTELEMQFFSTLKPQVKRDGNQWCVLYGEDLQSGIAGFGDTIYNAILDFNRQFNNPIL